MVLRSTPCVALAALLGLAGVALAATTGTKPIDPANFDTSVKPGDDFFRYANGKWLARNPIPPDRDRWGSFVELSDRNRAVLHLILQESMRRTDVPAGSATRMVGDFYASAMDSARAEADGAKPIAGELKRIDAVATPADLQAEFGHLQKIGVRAPFTLGAGQDARRSTEVIVQIGPGGLGLPDRDYYTKTDDASQKLRDQYVTHVARMFSLLGEDSTAAGAHARTVLAMETRLAGGMLTRVQRRDPEATYHRMPFDSLATICPAIAWPRLYDGLGIADRGQVNVGQPEFMKVVSAMLTEAPLADWKTYLRWHLLRSTAELLSAAFVNEAFDFEGRVLTGVTVQRPRSERSIEVVDRSIGEALGKLYVEKAFSPAAKARARLMVEELRVELRERIQQLDWMSAPTKEAALNKLDAFAVKIGYPDRWRDYSGLTIDRGPLVLNVIRAREFEFNRNIAKLGKPVDRTEWNMTPPTVNAYYNARMNEIVFPAGILQPPFFDANADDAVNYGGIGAVIGHEMTHGFDDSGRKFDAQGNLRDWWTADDASHYLARTTLVEKQFDGYVAIDTIHVNGKLTLGENLADLGGLGVAYGALEKALAGKPKSKIDGFTPEQRFFLSYATIWRQTARPEALKLRLNTDPHSPGRFRCNGPLSNLPEFAQAFGLKEGDPMVRPANLRTRIW